LKSVGEILKNERLKQGRTTVEVADAIKTKEKNVIAIENNDFSVFPGDVYALSFVRDFAEYLKLNANEVTPFFRRTIEIERKNKPEKDQSSQDLSLKNGRVDELGKNISKKILSFGTMIILIIFVGFLLFEYQRNILHPGLEIISPKSDLKTNEKSIVVSGKTDLENKVFVNDEEVELDAKGKFHISVALKKGSNKIIVRTVNSYQKLTEIERNVYRK